MTSSGESCIKNSNLIPANTTTVAATAASGKSTVTSNNPQKKVALSGIFMAFKLKMVFLRKRMIYLMLAVFLMGLSVSRFKEEYEDEQDSQQSAGNCFFYLWLMRHKSITAL